MISMPAAGPTPPSPVPGTRPAGTRDETDASREVRQMFSRIAPRYDLLNHLLSLRFDIFWRKRLARRFAHILARPGARVLDVCCGTGDLTLAFAHTPATAGASQTRSILGVDFAHPMLVRARQKSPGAQLHFIEADAPSRTAAYPGARWLNRHSRIRRAQECVLPQCVRLLFSPRTPFAGWNHFRQRTGLSLSPGIRGAISAAFGASPSHGGQRLR